LREQFVEIFHLIPRVFMSKLYITNLLQK
jgi:hypothetical protein